MSGAARAVAVEIRATTWSDPAALALRDAMTAEVTARYADQPSALALPPGMAVEPHEVGFVCLAHLAGRGIGHVAVRHLPAVAYSNAGPDWTATLEIKRMYVDSAARGLGIGQRLLDAAEDAAWRAGARRIVLQTGDRQPEAVALYRRAGYLPVPLFAPYLTLPQALCFSKWRGKHSRVEIG